MTRIVSAAKSEVGRRRSRRWRRAAITGAAAVAAQGSSLAIALISIPLTVGYLGVSRFAAWVVLSSFVVWLTMSDLGLVSALINGLAIADGRKERQYGHQLVATAFWMMVALASIFALSSILLEQAGLWPHLIANPQIATPEVAQAATLAILCFCVGFPFMVTDAVYRGLQEGYKMHFWSFAGSAAAFAALIFVTRGSGGLTELVAALLGVRSLVRLLNFAVTFGVEHPDLAPHPRFANRKAFRALMQVGIFYFVQQIGALGMFQLQPLVLLRLAGTTAVAEFNVAYRAFTVPQQIVFFVLAPFIPAYSEAATNGDFAWIRRALRANTWACTVFAVCAAIALIAAGPFIISKWIGHGIVVDPVTLRWLGLYIATLAVASSLGALLQGLGGARQLAIATVATGGLTLIAGIILAARYGAAGMAAAMTIGIVVANIPLLYFGASRALHRTRDTGLTVFVRDRID